MIFKKVLVCLIGLSIGVAFARTDTNVEKGNGEIPTWRDTNGQHINAHGGGILTYNGTYYWFGEHRPEQGGSTLVGINCYRSTDLKNWDYMGVALSVSEETGSDIERGCIMERPKVIYNRETGKFVMWFHLELKGQGYKAARAAVAVSDNPEGPYRFIRSGRVNPGKWPLNLNTKYCNVSQGGELYTEWWTPEWLKNVDTGMFVRRDFTEGQMSRDMTLFVDDDGKAYHIYASEENLTLHIAELTDDYLRHNGRYIRLFPAGHNEAPTIIKRNGKYSLIPSGCTGWKPNEGRLFYASSIMGPWEQQANPCIGEGAEKTFGSQGTYVLNVKGNQYVFMADIWNPQSLM